MPVVGTNDGPDFNYPRQETVPAGLYSGAIVDQLEGMGKFNNAQIKYVIRFMYNNIEYSLLKSLNIPEHGASPKSSMGKFFLGFGIPLDGREIDTQSFIGKQINFTLLYRSGANGVYGIAENIVPVGGVQSGLPDNTGGPISPTPVIAPEPILCAHCKQAIVPNDVTEINNANYHQQCALIVLQSGGTN